MGLSDRGKIWVPGRPREEFRPAPTHVVQGVDKALESRLRIAPFSAVDSFLRSLAPALLVGVGSTLVGAFEAAAQQPSFGPLTYEEGSPLQRVGFTAAMENADVVEAGGWRLDVYNGYSNIFEQDSTGTHYLFLDMERLTTALTVRWGAAEAWEVGGRMTLETTGAGYLDGVILGWHDRWGFGNANRDRFPQDQYRVRLTDGNGTVYIDRPSRSLDLRDVRAFAKWRAAESADGRSLLSVRTVLRVPTVDRLDGNRRPDAALMAAWQLGMGSWYTHGMLGASVTSPSEELDGVLRGSTRFMALALERSLGSSLAALAQIHVQSAALRSFDHRELDRAPTNLVLGLAGRVGDGWTWDASFQEDVPADTPAVDFTITLRVGRTF